MRYIIMAITTGLLWQPPLGLAVTGAVPFCETSATPSVSLLSGRVFLHGLPNRAMSTIDSCHTLFDMNATHIKYAIHTDESAKVTEVYTADFRNHGIIRYQIDSTLAWASGALPIPARLTLLAQDLDSDGQIELCFQRSGGIDIYSAPDWQYRGLVALPGNSELTLTPVNLDHDSDIELYTTPGDAFSFEIRAVIIDYARATNSFQVIADIAAPRATAGQTAAADFDNDGRVEFITGNDVGGGAQGYGLFEWQDSTLVFIGQLPDQVAGYFPAVCYPLPGGIPHVILGSFRGDPGWTYSLLQAVGDNEFKEVHLFQKSNGYGSAAASDIAADRDCDGLDEIGINVFPYFEVWEWDTSADSFVQTCAINEFQYGNLFDDWETCDLDWDGKDEFSIIDPGDPGFHAFPGTNCYSCDPTGHCVPPPPTCVCACHADPACDGIHDVLDLVETVDVAFRAHPAQNDPGPLCNASQTDVDCDGATNILDVVKVVNVVFRNGSPTVEFCAPCLMTTRSAAGALE